MGPNEGDTVTIETVRCHPDSLFGGGRAEALEFTVTDAQAAALTTSETITIAGTAVTAQDLATGVTTTETLVTALNTLSDAGTIAAITWTNSGDVITGTYDAVGAVTSTDNSIGAIAGTVSTEGTATGANADDSLDFTTQQGCRDAITTIQAAYDKVAKNRAQLGAVQAQMESTIRNLANVVENTTAARSRIQDADFAAETAALTRAQMLQQAATSILAQANAQPQSVLELLQ